MKYAQVIVDITAADVDRVFDYAVPGEELHHNVVVIRKVSPTPKQYPRRFDRIKKAPL